MSETTDDLSQLLAATQLKHRLAARRQGTQGSVERFLVHALLTVPAYRKLAAAGLPPCLASFPLLDRQTVAQRHCEFISGAFEADELVGVTTSGTSGVPLRVMRDGVDLYAMWYDVFRVLHESLEQLRGALAPGTCFAVTVNDNPDREPNLTVNPSLNLAYVRRIIIGRGAGSDAEQAALALADRPALLCGRPRSLLGLAELLNGLGRTLRPAAVFSSGDNLYESERKQIEHAFNARLFNGYASQEMGLIALECERSGHLHVATERVVVEVLEEGAATPQPEGDGEFVVTCTDNWAMPLVRYRTGDLGSVTLGRCACGFSGQSLTRLDGRVSVNFVVNGRKFNPSVLNPGLEALPIRQFQIAQDAAGQVSVLWVAEGTPDTEAVQQSITQLVGDLLGLVPTRVTEVDVIGRPGEKVQRYLRSG